ncbi:Mitochondrial inner membrane protease subunit 1 [Termitomyces sp. J132]|nr:Mitochondrial inner membrane protease subunit 1 [Termitomyces sp. J132]
MYADSFFLYVNIISLYNQSFNWGCAIHLVSQYIGRPSFMYGPSMLPTLGGEGEIVIEDRLSYWLNPQLSRGELAILQSPRAPGGIICKRIIGLPGDIVCVDPTGRYAPSTEHVIVPNGHVWIAGDNADNSIDSRTYGPVSMSLIQGRLRARVSSIIANPCHH